MSTAIVSRVDLVSLLTLFLTALAPSLAQQRAVPGTTPPPPLPWVRRDPGYRGVIIFVHGVTGDDRSTWTSGTAYWPAMLTRDPAFAGQNIYVYRYPSPRLSLSLSVDELADNMRLILSTDGVLQHHELTFVSHSMGGVVTREFLLKYRTFAPKVRMLYFFATPTTGSPYATLAGLFSKNPQFRQLYPMQSDNLLGQMQSEWLAANLGLKSYCAYETQPLYGAIIVSRQSATNLCTQRLDPIAADHINIVKPTDESSTPYRALKAAFMETTPPRIGKRSSPVQVRRTLDAPAPLQTAQREAKPVIANGSIIAAHYPTGELFVVEPKTGSLRLLSARLGNISGIAIRPNGEIIVLDNQFDRKFLLLTGVDPSTGSHRHVAALPYHSKAQQALALEGQNSVLVGLEGALARVNLNSGDTRLVATHELLHDCSGIARTSSGELVVTALPDKLLKVNLVDGTTTVLSEGGLLWHPSAPTIEHSNSVLVGTAGGADGRLASVIRVDLATAKQHVVASGPFTTIAGLVIEPKGSILITDNGRGAPGDGFLARFDIQRQALDMLVSAQTSNWKYLNGRSIAIFSGVRVH